MHISLILLIAMSFQRVFSLFVDKEPVHSDLENKLVVLGRFYDPVLGEMTSSTAISEDLGNDSSDLPKGPEDGANTKDKNVNFSAQSEDSLVENALIFDKLTLEEAASAPQNQSSQTSLQLQAPKSITDIPTNVNPPNSVPEPPSSNQQINIAQITSKIQANLNLLFKDQPQTHPFPEPFLEDVRARLWLTYRVGFPPIARDRNSPLAVMGALVRGHFAEIGSEGFRTDCGWGCMIRTSQSLLANALVEVGIYDVNGSSLGGSAPLVESGWKVIEPGNVLESDIVPFFADTPKACFSIHNFVQKGRALGKSAGEWFGPSAASRSIQALCEEHPEAGLGVYIGEDSGEIYEADLEARLLDKPVLLLLGLRLGVDNVNPLYYDAVKLVLSVPQAVGIAGGRPSSSHYFFGYQGDNLLFLDPHVSNRPALKLQEDGTVSEEDLQSVHTTVFNKLSLLEMDPSMLVGFLIKDKSDWELFKKEVCGTSLRKIVHLVAGSKREAVVRTKSSMDMLPEVMVSSEGDEFVDLGTEMEPRRGSTASFEEIPREWKTQMVEDE